MSQPQKAGVPPLTKSGSNHSPTLSERGLTPAYFTERELKALREICRDADNDRYAKQMLADALARAEGKS